MSEREGISQVQEAVTWAASHLAYLSRHAGLDDRDRQSCKHIREMLEKAERYLYGWKDEDERA